MKVQGSEEQEAEKSLIVSTLMRGSHSSWLKERCAAGPGLCTVPFSPVFEFYINPLAAVLDCTRYGLPEGAEGLPFAQHF